MALAARKIVAMPVLSRAPAVFMGMKTKALFDCEAKRHSRCGDRPFLANLCIESAMRIVTY
eukprot:3569560-Rhodomonas_salina.2